MPKSETIAVAARAEDLDKAYASAIKGLAKLGIKMTTKAPDAKKIAAAMTANKKKAEFKLVGDASQVKLTVECGSTVNTLGVLDLTAQKDAEQRVAVLRSLVDCGLANPADLKAAELAAKGGPDPTVVANTVRAIQKKIDSAANLKAQYEALKTYDDVARSAVFLKDLETQAAAEHSTENVLFIKAVAANMAPGALIANFIADTAQHQINIPSDEKNAIMAGTAAPATAVPTIKKMIAGDTLVRMKAAKVAALNKIIAAAEKELAAARG